MAVEARLAAPAGRLTWQQALAHPRVVGLAGALKIDLGNETQRHALLAQAERHLQQLPPVDATTRPGDSAVILAAIRSASVPPLPLTPYQVAAALRSYGEIAAL